MRNNDRAREKLIRNLWSNIHVKKHILGVAAGSGMTVRYAMEAGADFILALSAGKFRCMGRSSHACYLSYANSNDLVKEFASRELLTQFPDHKIFLGINATDPLYDIPGMIAWAKEQGFAGIVNYPSICVIDGKFREALEEEGTSYDQEVEAVRKAHEMDVFTIAFVADEEQTVRMLEAGADMICIHLGLTKGGVLGGKKILTLDRAHELSISIFNLCAKMRPEVFRVIYGGPVENESDLRYIYGNSKCQGYIGGSVFEREPVEKAIYNTTKAFMTEGENFNRDVNYKILTAAPGQYEYIEFIQDYINEHYMERIQLSEIAEVLHVNQSYLSTLFKKKTGASFTDYLMNYRVDKAIHMLIYSNMTVRRIAEEIGYPDVVQFNKIFKKRTGTTPGEYRRENGRAERPGGPGEDRKAHE